MSSLPTASSSERLIGCNFHPPSIRSLGWAKQAPTLFFQTSSESPVLFRPLSIKAKGKAMSTVERDLQDLGLGRLHPRFLLLLEPESSLPCDENLRKKAAAYVEKGLLLVYAGDMEAFRQHIANRKCWGS